MKKALPSSCFYQFLLLLEPKEKGEEYTRALLKDWNKVIL